MHANPYSTKKTITLVTLVAVASCLAQTRDVSHVALRQETYSGPLKDLDQIVGLLDARRLRPATALSWEGQNLAVSVRAACRLLRADLSAPSGIYTLETESGDVLVARWQISDSPYGASFAWLWNTPETDTLIFQVDPSMLQADALRAFLERIVIWSDDHGPTKSVSIGLRPTGTAVGKGSFEGVPAGVDFWSLAAAKEGEEAFISISWLKGNGDEKPLGSVHVRERFPPLADRLKTVPIEALYSEIGKRHGPNPRPDPGARDEIVIGEILSRGELSESDIRRIVFPASTKVPATTKGRRTSGMIANSRLASLLAATSRRKELPKYASALADLLLTSPADSGAAHAQAVSLLGALHRAGIDANDTALQLLRRDEFVGVSLAFLARFAHGPDIVNQLSETQVPPQFQSLKKETLQTIRSRVEPAR